MESPADSTMHRQKSPTAAIEPLKRKSPDATARMVRDLLGLEVLRVVSSLSGLKDLQASILVFISTFCVDLFQRVPRENHGHRAGGPALLSMNRGKLSQAYH
jgi:hypothetical protein